jgi:phage N-6-adenine-methyltransferase
LRVPPANRLERLVGNRNGQYSIRINDQWRICFEWQEGDADGLTADWGTSTFCNPPYSNVAKWIAKAHAEWKKGKTVVMLINAITDTKAFHEYIYNQAELRFIKGRVKFINPLEPTKSQPSPKPSMLVVFKAPIKPTRKLKSKSA